MTGGISQAQPDDGAPLTWRVRAVAIGAVLSAMALVVLDAGMVNVALPFLTRSLGSTPGDSVLVVIAYQTALVMALLPCAAIGERFGERRVFTTGVALFTTASLLCAIAPDLSWLVTARFIQGLGGAAVMALGMSLMRQTVAAARLGAAIGWNAMTVALASAAAPAIGAAILAMAGWPWLFIVNIPVGAASLLAARWLPGGQAGGRPLDMTSIALNGAAFGLLVTGAELHAHHALAAGCAFLAGVGALIALVRREGRKPDPMAPLDLLALRPLRVSVIASVLCFTGQSLALVALPFHLQSRLGPDLGEMGLYLSLWPLSVAGMALLAGRLSDRLPSAWLCAAGGLALAVGLAAMALWPPDGDHRALILFTSLCGLGFGIFQTPNNRNMFLSAPLGRSAAAGGLQGTARLSGQTAGAVLMTLLFGGLTASAAPPTALAIGAALALAAGVVSLLGGPRRGSAVSKA